jgi:hypothetical protein
MGSIDNGTPQGFTSSPGQDVVLPGSIRDAEDRIRSLGYDGIDFRPLGREFVASSYNARGQRAEAIGRTRELAARSLVRVLVRR